MFQCVDLPNMLVEIVKLVNHSFVDEIVLEHFSSILVNIPWLPTIIIDIEVTAIGLLNLGLLDHLLVAIFAGIGLNNMGTR